MVTGEKICLHACLSLLHDVVTGEKDCLSAVTARLGLRLYGFISKKWYIDNIYNEFIVKNFLAFGYHVSFKTIDRGFVEYIGPYGIVILAKKFSNTISRLQTGYVYNYTAMTLIGSILFITLIGLWDILNVYVDHRLYIIMLYIVVVYNNQSSNK